MSEQTVVNEESEKSKHEPLGSLTAVEAVMNKFALKYALKHGIKEDQFTICLVTSALPADGIMCLKRGPIVQIMLHWPAAQSSIKTILDDAFRTIKRKKYVDCMSIEPVLHIETRKDERRKLFRKQIGRDESDIILDLIPKHRIRVQVTTTITYSDVLTNESITVKHEGKKENLALTGGDMSEWLKLSRIVREKYTSEATRYEDEPELENALTIGQSPAISGVENNEENEQLGIPQRIELSAETESLIAQIALEHNLVDSPAMPDDIQKMA